MLAIVFALWLSISSAEHTSSLWANASTPAFSKPPSSSASTLLGLPTERPSSSSNVQTNAGNFVAAGMGIARGTNTSSKANPSTATDSTNSILTMSLSTTTAITSQTLLGNYTLTFTRDSW